MSHDTIFLRKVNIYRIIKWSKGVFCPECHSYKNENIEVDIFSSGFYRYHHHKCKECGTVFYIDDDMCNKCDFKDNGVYTEKEAMDLFRQIRWDNGVFCPECNSHDFHNKGSVKRTKRRRYSCKSCGKNFDDFTETIFSSKRKKPFRKTLYILSKIFTDEAIELIVRKTELNAEYIEEIIENFKDCFENEKKVNESIPKAYESMLKNFLLKNSKEEDFPLNVIEKIDKLVYFIYMYKPEVIEKLLLERKK
ncbi:hypothetical protein SDC9_07614 [bioreactor metagenome]|uniref:Transposase zinc-ribbon domain-containing protein n=1 Tax=bioreactor metagenome TaxID=1076179 RepID=A0A644T5D5_9ZZZZ|nr:transposase [Methanobrevibacter sp.]MEA4957735.1 transposase [Methanobrevibacter sp.]